MRNIFMGLLGILLGTFSCYAQSTTSMRGVITDPSGGVIPEAIVTITNADNGLLRRNVTDASGEYKFLQIAPGTYKLSAEKEGFATMTRSDVKLLVNTPTTLDLAMAVSATGEVVNVARGYARNFETAEQTRPAIRHRRGLPHRRAVLGQVREVGRQVRADRRDGELQHPSHDRHRQGLDHADGRLSEAVARR